MTNNIAEAQAALERMVKARRSNDAKRAARALYDAARYVELARRSRTPVPEDVRIALVNAGAWDLSTRR